MCTLIINYKIINQIAKFKTFIILSLIRRHNASIGAGLCLLTEIAQGILCKQGNRGDRNTCRVMTRGNVACNDLK